FSSLIYSASFFFFFIILLPPTSTLFPYTTLFRSSRHNSNFFSDKLVLAIIQTFFLISWFSLLLLQLLRHLFYRHLKLHRQRYILDRKSGSAGMPRPISYAVFCLKKKKSIITEYLA